jgi:hypothetical protein
MSYYRKCKHCGRTIQLRQMPGGQWVAFEGYDHVHNCSTPPRRSNKPADKRAPTKATKPQLEPAPDVGFHDFELPGSVIRSSSARSEPARPGAALSNVEKVLHMAVTKHLVVRIWYSDPRGGVTRLAIEPLVIRGEECVAYCRQVRGLRSFRLDGIRDLTLTNVEFVPKSIPRAKASAAEPDTQVQRSSSTPTGLESRVSEDQTASWRGGVWFILIGGGLLLLLSLCLGGL